MSDNNSSASCRHNACCCLGYGYVPKQQFGCYVSAEDALAMGSLFPELSLTIDEYGKICKQCGGACDGK